MARKKRQIGLKQKVKNWNGEERLTPREYAVYMSMAASSAKKHREQGKALRSAALGAPVPATVVVIPKSK